MIAWLTLHGKHILIAKGNRTYTAWFVLYLRCTCGHCAIMSTSLDCVCCKEIPEVCGKINELGNSSIHCITEHPGFDAVCLNVWVLQVAYYQYRQQYGVASLSPTVHE